MGMQISRRVHPEVSQTNTVCATVQLRQKLGEVLRTLATQKESTIEEGHVMSDHVHMLISIPPKYSVSQVVGYINGKSAIHLARVYGERLRNFVGQHFWA